MNNSLSWQSHFGAGEPQGSASKIARLPTALPRLSSIGTLCRLLGTTHRAIRFYEEIGLIEAIRAPDNTRMFDETARQRLEWITKLRGAGVSLKDIQEILEFDQSSDDLAALHRRAIDKITRRAEQLRKQIASAEAIARELRHDLSGEPCEIDGQESRAFAG
jgi:DNA-binding transcriptional MerR regulator